MNELRIKDRTITLVDQVEEKLLDYFRSHKMKPGDPIPKEQDLCEALGVARSVLREALSRLRMLGMIESRTRRGMVLREPHILGGLQRVLDPEILGDETLFNLLGFRVALELGICDSIFDNLTDKHIAELEDIVKKGVVYENNMYLPVSEHQFHSKLYEITGNKMIMQFQEIIYPVSLFVRNRFKDFFEPINKELKKQGALITHYELFIYLKNRDREGFRMAIRKHFTMYSQFVKNNGVH
jgi:GntR family transcriptional regulator, transcriptional repressor for pyruvate dehydrogenase complex